MHLRPRVLADEFLVQDHAEPCAIRQSEVAVDDVGVAGRDVLHPVLGEVVEMLLDLEVRDGRGEVEARRSRDGAADVVRRDQDVVRLRPGGDLLRLENATRTSTDRAG